MTARSLTLLLEGLGVLAVVLAVYLAWQGVRWSRRGEYARGFDAGWDGGTAAERVLWENATGTTRDALAAWQAARKPEPGPEGEWPYEFTSDPEIPPAALLLADDAAERLAAADAALREPPPVPSVAEVDQLAAEYKRQSGWTPGEYARHNHSPNVPCVKLCPAFDSRMGPAEREFWRDLREHDPYGAEPVVADVTSARAPALNRPASLPSFTGEDDTPAVAGVVVTGETPGEEWDRIHPGWREQRRAADWDVLAGQALPDYAAAALGGHRTVDECVDSIMMRAVRP